MTSALSQLCHVQCDLAVTQLRIFNVAKAGAGMPPFFSCLAFNEAVGGSIRSSLTQQDQKKRKKNPHAIMSEHWQLDFIETSIAFHHKSEPSRNRKRKKNKKTCKKSVTLPLCCGLSWGTLGCFTHKLSISTCQNPLWTDERVQPRTKTRCESQRSNPASELNRQKSSNQKSIPRTHLWI